MTTPEPCYKCKQLTFLKVSAQAKIGDNFTTIEKIPACKEHGGREPFFSICDGESQNCDCQLTGEHETPEVRRIRECA